MSATLMNSPGSSYADPVRTGLRKPEDHHGSGVAWSAIFAGAFAAISVGLILVTLGSGFGLAAASPWPGQGASATALTVVTAGSLVVLHWISSGIGGYLTGRLRTKWVGLHTHEVFFRDTANGFVTWAVATIFGAAIVAMAAGMASTVASNAASGVTGAPSGYVLDTLFRTDHVTATDADVKAQSGRILLNAVSTGEMPAQDKAYLTQAVATSTGIAPADAEKRVDAVMADVTATKVKAKQAVDAARKATSAASIFTGLAMLIGAFVACVAAAIGGQQRDAY